MAAQASWTGAEHRSPRAVIDAWFQAGGGRGHEITALELTSLRDEWTTVELTMKLSAFAPAPVPDDLWVRCTGVSGFKLDQADREIFAGHLEVEDLQGRGWDTDKVFRIFDPEQDDGISFYARTLEWCVGARPAR